MLKMKWAKEYLVFTKKDRIGIIFFTLVIAASIMLPQFFAQTSGPVLIQQDPALILGTDSLKAKVGTEEPGSYSEFNSYEVSEESAPPGELFFFDPNTASANEWKRLGLREKTRNTIKKYVSKGGKFRRPEDLLKIWGLPQAFYERVHPYIRIAADENYRERNFTNETRYQKTEFKTISVNVNLDDTTAFIALPGIGNKLAARIVNFRDKLGGFYSVEQVGETYGLPDSTFQKIKGRLQIDGGNIRKINVNTATKDELKVHPYIRWNLANAIVEYRNQHGAFGSLEDLKNIVLIDEATFKKVRPYLTL